MVREIKVQAPGIKVEVVPIDSVVPHPRNPRKHDERNLSQIKASLKAFGQRIPLVIGDNDFILAGNGRHHAMKALGFKTVAITRALGLTQDEELAFLLADNKTGDSSEFDWEGVQDILKHLHGQEFDLSKTAFLDFEIEPLLEGEFKGTETAMPEGEAISGGKGLTITFEGDAVNRIKFLLEWWKKDYFPLNDKQHSDAEIIWLLVESAFDSIMGKDHPSSYLNQHDKKPMPRKVKP